MNELSEYNVRFLDFIAANLKIFVILNLVFSISGVCQPEGTVRAGQNWTHYVKIAGHGLALDNIDDIMKSATDTYVFGIEVDNSLTGYYESFLQPKEKLKAIKAMAEAAHAAGNKVFIYTEGLETITSNADRKEHTFFKDHPDWVQRKITGEPAIFGGGTAFWIEEGEEDVWISPYAVKWREIFMQRIRQIAATGIDGIFVDIPYWMTHFDGWEDSWASFDNYTLAAFKERTGLNAKTDLKLGDFNDPNFVKWIDFRIWTLTEFMKDVNQNGKSVNPDLMTIAEIFPGIESAAVRVGTDVYEMYQVVDVIAHEYSTGGFTSAEKSPLDWFAFLTGIYSFRAFAEGKATWMLTYSWDGTALVHPSDAMENLMMVQLVGGANCWDTRGHVMSGSNDYGTRTEIFNWIGQHENTFYLPRKPIDPIGVYFSHKTRNYFANEFIQSYRGIMFLLLQSHLEFQIVTPRTLMDFQGKILILPDIKCIGDKEVKLLESFSHAGNSIIITGETGMYDLNRKYNDKNPIHELFGITKPHQSKISTTGKIYIYEPECFGKKYYQTVLKEYNEFALKGKQDNTGFSNLVNDFRSIVLNKLKFQPSVKVEASPFISTQIASVKGNPHVFIANFKGIKAGENVNQMPEKNVKIHFRTDKSAKVYGLNFLGKKKIIKSTWKDGKTTCIVPEIKRGMVVWSE